MANIPISDIQTTATSVSNDDYLLISKKNGTDSFISAKIKGSDLNGLSLYRIVEDDVIVYISPTGSDTNLENQYKYYGTSDQVNYSLYSINAAASLLSRFNTNKTKYILCADGTYNYTETQQLSAAQSQYGIMIVIMPQNQSNSNVTFSFTNCDGIGTSCYVYLKKIKLVGNDSTNYSGFNQQIVSKCVIDACEISNFRDAVRIEYGSVCVLRSYEDGTLNYFHDCNQGANVDGNSSLAISGKLKIVSNEVCFYNINHGIIHCQYPSEIHLENKSTSNKYCFHQTSNSIIRFDRTNMYVKNAVSNYTSFGQCFDTDPTLTMKVTSGGSTVTIPLYSKEGTVFSYDTCTWNLNQ